MKGRVEQCLLVAGEAGAEGFRRGGERHMHMHAPGSWLGRGSAVPSRMKPTRRGHMEL